MYKLFKENTHIQSHIHDTLFSLNKKIKIKLWVVKTFERNPHDQVLHDVNMCLKILLF